MINRLIELSLRNARDLPLNTPVVVEFTPSKKEVEVTCGMRMFTGRVVIE